MSRILLALLLAGGAVADPVHGLWQTEPGDSGAYLKVEIGDCAGGGVCGRIAEVVGAEGDIAGRTIISGMQADGDGRYSGGTIWAPDRDRTYRSRMRLAGGALEVSGCVLGGTICRSQTWSRLR